MFVHKTDKIALAIGELSEGDEEMEKNESQEVDDTGGVRVDRPVRWLPGWYASRLHAIDEDKAPVANGIQQAQAICGQWIYGKAPTDWAQRYVDRGVPHCKRCEKLLST